MRDARRPRRRRRLTTILGTLTDACRDEVAQACFTSFYKLPSSTATRASPSLCLHVSGQHFNLRLPTAAEAILPSCQPSSSPVCACVSVSTSRPDPAVPLPFLVSGLFARFSWLGLAQPHSQASVSQARSTRQLCQDQCRDRDRDRY